MLTQFDYDEDDDDPYGLEDSENINISVETIGDTFDIDVGGSDMFDDDIDPDSSDDVFGDFEVNQDDDDF